ncbi:hypothetical protein ACHAW6_000957 [Cyclotella cf. meneghiniana]
MTPTFQHSHYYTDDREGNVAEPSGKKTHQREYIMTRKTEMGCDAVGSTATPIEFLVLEALQYLGREWSFNNIEEATAMSVEVHHCFFHVIIDFSSTVLYAKYVIFPSIYDKAKRYMEEEFMMAGMMGCVGSMGGTHITIHHLGGNSKCTTRSYNMTANHCKRTLHSTLGGPHHWNDKMRKMFDTFLKHYQDGYVTVDNGYLRWSLNVPPYEITNKQLEIRGSKWVESIRKDVECTFGILKGCWHILKSEVRLQGVDVVDKVRLTCCTLHNWLLNIDGLDTTWEGHDVCSV